MAPPVRRGKQREPISAAVTGRAENNEPPRPGRASPRSPSAQRPRGQGGVVRPDGVVPIATAGIGESIVLKTHPSHSKVGPQGQIVVRHERRDESGVRFPPSMLKPLVGADWRVAGSCFSFRTGGWRWDRVGCRGWSPVGGPIGRPPLCRSSRTPTLSPSILNRRG
jgi:hypothetical protein